MRRAVHNEHEHEPHPTAMLPGVPAAPLLMQTRSPYARHRLAGHAFGGAPAKQKRRLLNNMATDKDAEQSLRDVGLRTNIYGQYLTRDGSVLVSRPPSPLTSMLE